MQQHCQKASRGLWYAHSAMSACQLRHNVSQLTEVLARLLQLVHGAALSAQEESSDLLAVGDAANAKLRMLEDRNGVVVQVRSPQCRRHFIKPLRAYAAWQEGQEPVHIASGCLRAHLLHSRPFQSCLCPRSR